MTTETRRDIQGDHAVTTESSPKARERTDAQREQSKLNGARGRGPRDTSRTRWNAFKHGLRAEQHVVPGEDPAAFGALADGWVDDWRPGSQTAAALCEVAALAHWRLKRAARVESARLHELGADAAHDLDRRRSELVDGSLHRLHREPDSSLFHLRWGPTGLECLVDQWEALDRAAAEPSRWASRHDHHDRLLALLGHPAGSEPDLEVARASLALLAAHEPGAAPAAASASATIRAACAEQLADVRRALSKHESTGAIRQRFIDCAIAPVTKESQLMLRYEKAIEGSLRWALRQLMALARSGPALGGPDAPDGPSEPAPAEASEPPPPADPPAAPAGPSDATSCDVNGSGSSGSFGAGTSVPSVAAGAGAVPTRAEAPIGVAGPPARGPSAARGGGSRR